MDRVHQLLEGFPSQEKVATLLLSHGIRVSGGRAFCGDIEQTDAALARAAGVDHRVVRSALNRISSTPELDGIYSKLRSTLLMSELAPAIGCSTVEIVPTDASIPSGRPWSTIPATGWNLI